MYYRPFGNTYYHEILLTLYFEFGRDPFSYDQFLKITGGTRSDFFRFLHQEMITGVSPQRMVSVRNKPFILSSLYRLNCISYLEKTTGKKTIDNKKTVKDWRSEYLINTLGGDQELKPRIEEIIISL